MTQEIKITLPPVVAAMYAVPIIDTPAKLKESVAEAVKKRVEEPVRDIALKVIGSDLFEVQVIPKDQIPQMQVDVHAAMGVRSELLAIMEEAKEVIVLRALNAPSWPPYHEFVTLAAAGALAAELNSLTIDLCTWGVLSPTEAAEKLPDEHKPVYLADWLIVLQSPTENGSWMTTRGLSRLGLPEVQTIGVPSAFERSWSMAMTGIAWNIIKYLGEHTQVDETAQIGLPAEMDLSEADIAEAYQDQAAGEGHVRVHFRLDPPLDNDGSEFLTVVAPASDNRPFGEYIGGLCAELTRI